MKIRTISLCVLITLVAASIFVANQGMVRAFIHHAIYPSPIKWNNIKICYGKSLFHKVSDNGLKLNGWFSDISGFLGISNTNVSDYNQLLKNIEKEGSYKFISMDNYTIDGCLAHQANYSNEDGKATKFILVPSKHIVIIYDGPEENFHIFKNSIDCIKFLKE